jgi:DNA-binding PadR family transcriptional regulator
VSIRHALLAILDQGPCYGNQLRAEYNRRTGNAWPLNVGQIYTTLDRLERDGLVLTGDRDAQGHLFYEISAAGTVEVADWFASPVDGQSQSRDDVATQVALAVTLPGVDAAAVIRVQLAAAEARAAFLSDSGEDTVDDALAATIIVDARLGAAHAEVTWLRAALDRVTTAGISVGKFPLDTTVPRRGRPRNDAS